MSEGGPKRLVVLGSTGSIGEQTLAVAAEFPDDYRVVGLAAGRNVAKLVEQIRRHRPEIVSVAAREDAEALRELLHVHLGVADEQQVPWIEGQQCDPLTLVEHLGCGEGGVGPPGKEDGGMCLALRGHVQAPVENEREVPGPE